MGHLTTAIQLSTVSKVMATHCLSNNPEKWEPCLIQQGELWRQVYSLLLRLVSYEIFIKYIYWWFRVIFHSDEPGSTSKVRVRLDTKFSQVEEPQVEETHDKPRDAKKAKLVWSCYFTLSSKTMHLAGHVPLCMLLFWVNYVYSFVLGQCIQMAK
mgnify:CR=1 FL=1